jgi:hypothetical protein
VVLREQLSPDRRTPVISELLTELKLKNLRAMESIIHEGQKLGIFRSEVDVPMLSSTLFGTVNQLLSTKQYYCTVYGIEDLTEEEQDAHMIEKLKGHFKKIFQEMIKPELNDSVTS